MLSVSFSRHNVCWVTGSGCRMNLAQEKVKWTQHIRATRWSVLPSSLNILYYWAPPCSGDWAHLAYTIPSSLCIHSTKFPLSVEFIGLFLCRVHLASIACHSVSIGHEKNWNWAPSCAEKFLKACYLFFTRVHLSLRWCHPQVLDNTFWNWMLSCDFLGETWLS